MHGFSSHATERAVIVNGDDFGLSPGVNRGIVEAYCDGILTSASLMVVGDAFEEAVALAHKYPALSIGVHLTLVEGVPVLPPTQIPSLVMSDGRFFRSLGMFLTRWLQGRIQREEVRREFKAQIERALEHGVIIDKFDSHMHVHLLPGIFESVLMLARQYDVAALRLPKERIIEWSSFPAPVGLWRRAMLTFLATTRQGQVVRSGLFSPDHFSGIAESGRLTEDDLLRILRGLNFGITEVMVHPGYCDSVLNTWPQSNRYARERELRALTSSKVKALVQDCASSSLAFGQFRSFYHREYQRRFICP